MKFANRCAMIALGALFLLPAVAFADTYHTATFSGQLGSSPNVKAPFAGNGFTANGAITGSFVYDDNLIPSSGSGFVNVFFSTFPDIGLIPDPTAFNLSVGGLTFTLGDALVQFPTQEAAIQYNNGVFNGFFYVSDFTFLGNPYELSLQGSTFTIVPIVNGFPTFTHLVNGHLNIGDANLSDISVFTPTAAPTPEPGTLVLLGAPLLALIVLGRKLV